MKGMYTKDDQYKKIVHRLHRIEGQVRGIEKMIDTNIPPENIIIQIQAIQSAMMSIKKLLIEHMISLSSSKEETVEIINKYFSK